MLNEMSPPLQRIWLSKAVNAAQLNDQMHMPEPQAMLSQWTAQACAHPTVEESHARNLARYWAQGLRYPAHGAICRNKLGTMLAHDHMRQPTLESVDAVLAAEVQPLRMLRLWALLHNALPNAMLVPHLERLLAAPLMTGKKLKITQVALDSWPAWVPMRSTLSPDVFAKGMFLYTRAHLTSRQESNPVERVAGAWAMLTACEEMLPVIDSQSDIAALELPPLLSVLLEHADSQTLRCLPWPEVQTRYASQPSTLVAVWKHLFDHHKTLLLGIMPSIEHQFHAGIRAWFLDMTEFSLEEDRCAPLMRLIKEFPDWGVLLTQMLGVKTGYQKLGTYLLGTNQGAPAAVQQPGAFLASLTGHQWFRMFVQNTRHTLSPLHLFALWELVRVHKLTALATCSFLQKATLAAIPTATARLHKIAMWDVSLGLPAFYATLLKIYLSPQEEEAWFDDWIEKPSTEKMIVRAFQWFNPDIKVPPLPELQLLAQALDNGSIIDILAHMTQKIETIELPCMVE